MFTAAYFDELGRYAYGRQPDVVFWNLQQLAGCLALVTEGGALIAILNRFGEAYHEALREAAMRRLGLKRGEAAAETALVRALFGVLDEGKAQLGFEPLFFDWFGGQVSKGRAMSGRRAALYDRPAAMAFRDALGPFEADRPERLSNPYFDGVDPQDMLIDEVNQGIWAPIDERDDWAPFEAKLKEVAAAGAAMA